MVTGGLGMNGAWVLRELLAAGHTVTVLDNRADVTLVPDLAGQLDIARVDITDLDEVRAACRSRSPDRIIHLAAVVGADRSPLAATDANIRGTAVICQVASELGVDRVVYTSSKAIYGSMEGKHGHPDYDPVSEDQSPAPRRMYDITKYSAELVGRWYARTRGLEFISLRFATIFGPGKWRRHGAVSVYASLVEGALATSGVELPRGRDQRDDIVYALDVARAIALVGTWEGKLPHDTYNIGSGRTVSVEDFAAAVRRRLPHASITVGPGLDPVGNDGLYYSLLNSSRALADLDWRPVFTLDLAMEHYVDSMRRLGLA
jgi:UDP-glucose 4-epimerase